MTDLVHVGRDRRTNDDGLPAVDLTTVLAGVEFANPVFTASGCSAAGQELAAFFDPATLGGVVTKSIMLAPRSGRATPRMAETPSGMLNSIGLQGPGIEEFLDRDLPWLAARGARAVVSIAGSTVEDYAKLAAKLRGHPGIAFVEVNISCPNVEDRGQVFACDPRRAGEVISAVRRNTSYPVFAKLSPDVTSIVDVAQACVDAGAHGLSMINTLLGMDIDPDSLRPTLAGITGGLSGPAIRPVAVRCVYEVHAAVPGVPILGMGGIRTGLDALQFLAAGASAISVGTAIFGDPSAPVRILAELRQALAARGYAAVADVVGIAHRPVSKKIAHRPGTAHRPVDPGNVHGPVETAGSAGATAGGAVPEGPDPVGDTLPAHEQARDSGVARTGATRAPRTVDTADVPVTGPGDPPVAAAEDRQPVPEPGTGAQRADNLKMTTELAPVPADATRNERP